MTWAAGLSVVTLFVEDLATGKDFYQRVLGLSLVMEDDSSAVLRLGGTLINLLDVAAAPELVEPADAGGPGSGIRAVMTIQVDDVDAVCELLAAEGVALLNGPVDRPWGVRTASFRDPGGHVWEIAR